MSAVPSIDLNDGNSIPQLGFASSRSHPVSTFDTNNANADRGFFIAAFC